MDAKFWIVTIIVVVILLTTVIDRHMPIVSIRVPMGGLELRIAVYDSDGYFSMLCDNLKEMVKRGKTVGLDFGLFTGK